MAPGRAVRLAVPSASLHHHALGEVARLVDVAVANLCAVVSEEL
jgi:hypothetical protein